MANNVPHRFSENVRQTLQELENLKTSIIVEQTPLPPKPATRFVGRNAYLPIEIAGRELYGRAKLAGDLVRRGFQVVLGATWNLGCNEYRDLPPGILLLKTLNALDAEKIKIAQKAGHIVAVLDEELFSIRPNAEWYRTQTNEEALHLSDMICAPGLRSADIFREVTDSKVEVTGTPRRLFPELEQGEDILVCTKAGFVNGQRSFRENVIHICRVYNKALSGEVLDYMKGDVIDEWAGLALLLDTVQALSVRFPSRRIRLRVHPAENFKSYQVGGNVVFDSSPSFFESLNGAAVLVFVSGCSTGIETFFAGVPSVRLGAGGYGLSHNLHVGAETANEAADAVAAQIESPKLLGDLSEHYSPLSLGEKLDELQREFADDTTKDVEPVWRKRKQEIRSQPLLSAKFPDTPDDVIAGLAGADAKSIGWNTWLLK